MTLATEGSGGEGSGARRVALAVVEAVMSGAHLTPTLSRELNAAALGAAPRSFATDLAYGTIRRLPQLDAALAPLLTAPQRLPPRVLNILRIGAYELLHRGTPPYAAVDSWVGVTRAKVPRLAPLVNAVLRRVKPPANEEALEEHERAALPEWLFREFERALPEAALEAALAMLEPGPLWLTIYSPRAAELLEEEGAEVTPFPFSAGAVQMAPRTNGTVSEGYPRSVKVRSPLPVAKSAAYTQGLAQPQNPSSLAAARMLGAGQGDPVYDLASGAGIKSAALAAMGAAVTAVERSARRSRAAERNLKRLGLSAEQVVADLTQPLELPPRPFVLLDAPCTGTGTLRGHPEIKLRLTPPALGELVELQLRLLTNAARLVAPGGRLVYAVCSLTHEEGAGVVSRFLAERGEFAPEQCPLSLPAAAPPAGGPGRYILPLGGLDGFYVAHLRRVNASSTER